MPLSGKGMLITFMDIDPDEEQDFHRWYDQQHFRERVAIDGFLEARRYVAVEGQPKYLHVYTTETFEDLDSPAYRKVLQNQTPWSMHHIPKFRNPTRVCGRISASQGVGRGGAVAFIRIRPTGDQGKLRAALTGRFDILKCDGILSVHLIEGDPNLSKPLVPTTTSVGFGDWYIVIDGTTPDAVKRIASERFDAAAVAGLGTIVSVGTYRHLADISKAELDT